MEVVVVLSLDHSQRSHFSMYYYAKWCTCLRLLGQSCRIKLLQVVLTSSDYGCGRVARIECRFEILDVSSLLVLITLQWHSKYTTNDFQLPTV